MGYQPPRRLGSDNKAVPLTWRDLLVITVGGAAMVAFALVVAGGLMAWRF